MKDDIERLLGGYAPGILDEKEKARLYQAALDDQEVFDALLAEEDLRDLLSDEVARRRILASLSAERREPRRSWFFSPALWATASSLATACGMLLFLRTSTLQRTAPPGPAPGFPTTSRSIPLSASRPASELFFASDAAGEGRLAGLKVRLYMCQGGCDLRQVPPDRVFGSGERLRFGVETNSAGFLYVVQKGTSGKTTQLFPHPEINGGDNRIGRGTEVVVPGKGWFMLDDRPGTEELTFVLTRQKTDVLRYLVADGAAPPPAPASGSLEDEVLQQLQGRPASRHLVVSQAGTAPAEAPGALYDPMYAVNTGPHGSDWVVLRMSLRHG